MKKIVPASAALVNDSIRIRDRYQFEIKFLYPMNRAKKDTTYDLECYLFVPRSLGMNSTNYSKARFYDDLQTNIRFQTPLVSLNEIIGGKHSPLLRLQARIPPLQGGNADRVDEFEYQLKIFCCILQGSLGDFVGHIGETCGGDDCEHLMRQLVNDARSITGIYRAMRQDVFQPGVAQDACEMYAFGDEYISLLVERNCYELLKHLDAAGTPGPGDIRRALMDLVASEVNYRKHMQYPSIPTDQNDNEQLIFRRNVLKKYMHNVLFLNTRTRHEGRMLEQGLFGIAAGISMLFATIVLFLSQSFYGPLSLPVFLALVIGYMFKDRIKELLRIYFSQKVSSMLFDHKTRIYIDARHPIGYCRESFDFIDESKVPVHIMKIRSRDHITAVESEWMSERIMRYRKQVRLFSRDISAVLSDLDTSGIHDIMRYNITEFTRHMGEPGKELFVMEEEGYRRVKAERVYHLNMILRYGCKGRDHYKRLRIVLNRRKIKRIETVSEEDT